MSETKTIKSEEEGKGWRNKDGNDGDCPNCDTWEKHWEKFSGKKFGEQRCSNKGCSSEAKHGSHVIHQSAGDQKEWIVPLCIGCNVTENLPNTPSERLCLKPGTILVNADPNICKPPK